MRICCFRTNSSLGETRSWINFVFGQCWTISCQYRPAGSITTLNLLSSQILASSANVIFRCLWENQKWKKNAFTSLNVIIKNSFLLVLPFLYLQKFMWINRFSSLNDFWPKLFPIDIMKNLTTIFSRLIAQSDECPWVEKRVTYKLILQRPWDWWAVFWFMLRWIWSLLRDLFRTLS